MGNENGDWLDFFDDDDDDPKNRPDSKDPAGSLWFLRAGQRAPTPDHETVVNNPDGPCLQIPKEGDKVWFYYKGFRIFGRVRQACFGKKGWSILIVLERKYQKRFNIIETCVHINNSENNNPIIGIVA